MKFSKTVMMIFSFCLFIFLALSVQTSFAQEVVVPTGTDLTAFIKADTLSNGDRAHTVYVLERGGMYIAAGYIINEGWHLHVKAQDGEGALPFIKIGLKPNNKQDKYIFNPQGDLTLENLKLTTLGFLGKYSRGPIGTGADGLRIVMKGCELNHCQQSVIRMDTEHNSFFMTDCIIANFMKPSSNIGRGIDSRGNNQDSLVARNCTFYNMNDRMYRHMGGTGGVVQYVEYDHCTIVHCGGYWQTFQLGKAKEVHITNNLMMNPLFLGDNPRRDEITHGEDGFFVFSIDTLYGDQILEIRNNNIWTEDAILAYYATNDSVSEAGILTEKIKGFLDADAADAYFIEPLTFGSVPETPIARLISYYEATEHVSGDTSQASWDNLDCTYPTTSQSYVAAEGGFPLGDLNWYPDKKAEWETYMTGVETNSNAQPDEFKLSQNYPNPFNPSTVVSYQISKTADVSLIIYNALGQKICTLVDQKLGAGSYKETWNGKNDRGASVAGGIYFYQLKADSETKTMKMLYLK